MTASERHRLSFFVQAGIGCALALERQRPATAAVLVHIGFVPLTARIAGASPHVAKDLEGLIGRLVKVAPVRAILLDAVSVTDCEARLSCLGLVCAVTSYAFPLDAENVSGHSSSNGRAPTRAFCAADAI